MKLSVPNISGLVSPPLHPPPLLLRVLNPIDNLVTLVLPMVLVPFVTVGLFGRLGEDRNVVEISAGKAREKGEGAVRGNPQGYLYCFFQGVLCAFGGTI